MTTSPSPEEVSVQSVWLSKLEEPPGKGMETPHVLVIPYPAQGHVIPLMELSRSLSGLGLRITFVNTEHNHDRIVGSGEGPGKGCLINFVSVSDGLESPEDRKKPGKLSEAVLTVLPKKVAELVDRIHRSDGIACVVADQSLGWALEIAREKGLRCAAFCPAAAAVLVQALNAPRMIEDGIIGVNGTPTGKRYPVEAPPEMPPASSENLVWARISNETVRKSVFELILRNAKSMELADLIVCNSCRELEPGAFELAPQILPIGPILPSNTGNGDSMGSFWERDTSCLEWLDRQPVGSVVYVAFGSFTVLDPVQSEELALGLELTNRPFLWVVGSETSGGASITSPCPEGFPEKVGDRGKIVRWAPQQTVLRHPSVACFLSHCGWNSVVEGLSCGVPFLCWPYFADQFLNQCYVCDVWKVGLGLKSDGGSGIVRGEEIAGKIEELVGGGGYKARALDLQTRVRDSIREGGGSHRNLEMFVRWLLEEGCK